MRQAAQGRRVVGGTAAQHRPGILLPQPHIRSAPLLLLLLPEWDTSFSTPCESGSFPPSACHCLGSLGLLLYQRDDRRPPPLCGSLTNRSQSRMPHLSTPNTTSSLSGLASDLAGSPVVFPRSLVPKPPNEKEAPPQNTPSPTSSQTETQATQTAPSPHYPTILDSTRRGPGAVLNGVPSLRLAQSEQLSPLPFHSNSETFLV
ncbi:hypothetical protein CCHR01_02809 [Colletotrichum chrysophilum]|uniref:Uncharacterized protein n=1 Tax=Colletotrichum chrysophilum TaxID=1836956 RepID=A0AAD9AUZ2_9PEZI|nr:hypothetical protein CCHR01_02809 [Colletotrichum chrysophilum]